MYVSCDRCLSGLKGKNEAVKDTNSIGRGLIIVEDMQKGECIIRYEGKSLKDKAFVDNAFVAEIEYEGDDDKQFTCYINATDLSLLARLSNHSYEKRCIA